MSLLAATRPTGWDFPLFLHVLGAMILVGGILTAVSAQLVGWRRGSAADAVTFGRTAFRALVFVALPAWFVMRIGAQWIYSKEGWSGDDDPTWLGIGYLTADLGGIVLLIAIILAGFGARRLVRTDGTSTGLARASTILAALVLIAYFVTVWAMTAKPS
ncbi:MAG TPA: hypothetical protein VH306_01160 [Gaiellaceae bacterium]|jgi:hypothetical protein